MDGNKLRQIPLFEIVDRLRRAGHTWFRNDDLLLLEELIRRAGVLRSMLLNSRNILKDHKVIYADEIDKQLGEKSDVLDNRS